MAIRHLKGNWLVVYRTRSSVFFFLFLLCYFLLYVSVLYTQPLYDDIIAFISLLLSLFDLQIKILLHILFVYVVYLA